MEKVGCERWFGGEEGGVGDEILDTLVYFCEGVEV
jgi:hypothetical protein